MATNNKFLLALPEFEVLHLTIPTLTSPVVGYPASAAIDFGNESAAKPSLSAAANDSWVWDFGSSTRVDGLWLWHNADAGITIRIQMNATNVWTSPTVDYTMLAPTKHKLGFTFKMFFDMTQASGYSTSGKRYLRIVIPTNSVPPGIKALAFSRFTRLDNGVSLNYYNPQMQSSITLATDFGHEWVYKIPAAREAMQLQSMGTEADRMILRQWFEACGRGIACCAVNTDSTNNTMANQGIIGRLVSIYSATTQGESGLNVQVLEQHPQAGAVKLTQTNFGIRELSAGLPEWT